MNKLFLLLLGLLAACTNPDNKPVDSLSMEIMMPSSALQRWITNRNQWLHWWPGKMVDTSHFLFRDAMYHIEKTTWNGVFATVKKDNDSVGIYLQILPNKNTETLLQLSSDPVTSPEIFAKQLKDLGKYALVKNMGALLLQLKTFFSVAKNVYGMPVQMEKVADSSFMSLSKSLEHYPTTNEIYEMIGALRNYIRDNKGEIINQPIMNIHQEQSGRFGVMIAIATKRDIKPDSGFKLKKMVLGNILKATVKGGPYTVSRATQQMQYYLDDFKKTSPAIPFQQLETERDQQPDTSKWVTNLYYPILN